MTWPLRQTCITSAMVSMLRLHGGLGVVERPQPFRGGTLAFIGLQLLDRQLPEPQLFKQHFDLAARLGRAGLADEHVDALDVEIAELAAQLLARLLLDGVAHVQQLQHGFLMGDVAEIGAEHRVLRLRDQLFDVAETLDDAGRLLVVDVDDYRQGQHRLVSVLGHQVDGAQAFVVTVSLGLAGDPVQNEIGRAGQG
jgi:hypothetical protein